MMNCRQTQQRLLNKSETKAHRPSSTSEDLAQKQDLNKSFTQTKLTPQEKILAPKNINHILHQSHSKEGRLINEARLASGKHSRDSRVNALSNHTPKVGLSLNRTMGAKPLRKQSQNSDSLKFKMNLTKLSADLDRSRQSNSVWSENARPQETSPANIVKPNIPKEQRSQHSAIADRNQRISAKEMLDVLRDSEIRSQQSLSKITPLNNSISNTLPQGQRDLALGKANSFSQGPERLMAIEPTAISAEESPCRPADDMLALA